MIPADFPSKNSPAPIRTHFINLFSKAAFHAKSATAAPLPFPDRHHRLLSHPLPSQTSVTTRSEILVLRARVSNSRRKSSHRRRDSPLPLSISSSPLPLVVPVPLLVVASSFFSHHRFLWSRCSDR
ncbi:hypothetical protein PIB30_052563 [Stylosanthes scabra]|uniref:Uncharacterized protein n=1 Tax=Stylosanthes scabra TaxID=79078 RepID=A0ABU6WGD8_9FABA|nr:hypothetical protein [Stylosanthes scabra]